MGDSWGKGGGGLDVDLYGIEGGCVYVCADQR